jgi:hypothetical protein
MIVMLTLIPLSFIAQIAWLYDHNPVAEFNLILNKLTILNYITMGTLLLGIPLFQRASRLLLIWLPVSFFVVALNNWSVSSNGQDFQVWQTSLASAAYIGVGLFALKNRLLSIILDPSKRWWCCSKRLPTGVPVKIRTKSGKTINAQTFDISKTGAFIKTREEQVIEGEKIYLEILTPSGPFTLEAKIIRTSGPQGHYPAGIGIKFSKLGLGARLLIQQMTESPT